MIWVAPGLSCALSWQRAMGNTFALEERSQPFHRRILRSAYWSISKQPLTQTSQLPGLIRPSMCVAEEATEARGVGVARLQEGTAMGRWLCLLYHLHSFCSSPEVPVPFPEMGILPLMFQLHCSTGSIHHPLKTLSFPPPPKGEQPCPRNLQEQ